MPALCSLTTLPKSIFLVLDDPSQPGYVLLNNGWNGGDSWKFSGRFEKYSENREISDWMFKVEFPEAVSNIQVRNIMRFYDNVVGLWLSFLLFEMEI